MTPQLEHGRRMERRRYARASFCWLIVQGILVVGKLLLTSDPALTAAALNAAVPVLMLTAAVPTTIVLAYLGISSVERMRAPNGGQDAGNPN